MTEPTPLRRREPDQGSVLEPRPDLGGGRGTPAFDLPAGATNGLPDRPESTRIGPRTLRWGTRTFVMGILNITPDSFSGDGLLATRASSGAGIMADTVAEAVDRARAMADSGADLLDIGGESSRPGHDVVDPPEEISRIVPVIEAVRAALPTMPISVDTSKPEVAAAAIQAGADLINDVWGVADDDRMARLAAGRRVPIIVMHNRAEARYTNLMPEIVVDLQRAIERTLGAGVAWDDILIDPGFGFGKTAEHNLVLLRELPTLAILGRPILLGTSRKSTLGRILDLPADQRLEATLATTALAIAAGVDLVRVHDVRENVRVARMADAVVRGTEREDWA